MLSIDSPQSTFAGQLDRFRQSPRLAKRRRVNAAVSGAADSPTGPLGLNDAVKAEVSSEAAFNEGLSACSSVKHHEASSSPTSGPGNRRKRKASPQSFEGMAEIPDRLAYDLNILFCGYNPGVRSSEMGYHYAHPSNRFYRILADSGLTDRRLKPEESPSMPEKYSLGLTDLVARCTARADQVSSLEFQAGAVALLRKIIEYRPKMVCFVGMDVFRNFRKHFPAHAVPQSVSPKKASSNIKAEEADVKTPWREHTPSHSPLKQSKSDVQLGVQQLVLTIPAPDEPKRRDVLLYVIPSTSGLAAGYSDADRVAYLQDAARIVKDVKGGHENSHTLAATRLAAEQYLQDRVVNTGKNSWALMKSEQEDVQLKSAG